MKQHLRLLLLMAVALLHYACQEEKLLEKEEIHLPITASIEMANLSVPEGFIYRNTRDLDLTVSTVDSTGKTASNVLVYLIGLSDSGDSDELFSGLTNDNGELHIDLPIPQHFQSFIIKTLYGNANLAHPAALRPVMHEELTVNGMEAMQTLQERGQNCYPSITGLFSSDHTKVGVSSSEPIKKATLYFTNGSSQKINNLGNQIFFTSDREICHNGRDDDGDGLADCADPECGASLGDCSGSMPCVSSFFQIIGRNLKQLDPRTGSYKTIGTLPAGYTYNGGGYNQEDGYMYCTAKDNLTKQIFMARLYSNGNISLLDEINNFEGRSYTGDMDGEGNWTNFYFKDGDWYKATIDVSKSNLQFTTKKGNPSAVGDANFHDWVYNKACDRFYALTAGGQELLMADPTGNKPTISSVATYNGLPGGAYGAAWTDDEGHLYFSNNNTGKIYKVTMNSCNPTSMTLQFTGASASNNDGMSCPSAAVAEFGGFDTDGDGIPDSNELDSYSNPLDGCSPLFDVGACNGSLNYGFVCSGRNNQEIAYVKCDFGCKAPDEYACIYNDALDNDIDKDLVPNAADPDPVDPNQTFIQYRPSKHSFGTYAFEDLWPETGDYDFNDMVIQLQERIVTNGVNKVFKVIYDIRVMAMGGIFNNNLGIVTPDPGNKATVNIISPHNVKWTSTQMGNKEVIIIEKPKQMFYSLGVINAWNNDPYYQPLEFQVEVELNGNYSYPNQYESQIFIEQHAIDGHEIHIAGHAPTPNMKSGLMGTKKDDSNPANSKFFLTGNNLPWGIYIPTEWKYPQEGIDLTAAYIRFAEYAQENQSLDWYTDTPSNVVSSRVYSMH